ncbi:alpha/beta hydrolase [Curtobacterium sp. NPDC089689]|uniref:alpha/beta hydrolase n=1 Tax=Curtobacterium sp. NPDC089689 TaxID=3363968 RepID=UPI00380512D3
MSAAAREVLARTAGTTPFPDPTDVNAWHRVIAAGNQGMRAYFATLDLSTRTRREVIRGVDVWVTSDEEGSASDSVILDIHGGAMILGGGDLAGLIARRSAHGTGRLHWAVDYRMPPDHPFPTPVDDVATVLDYLIGRIGAEHVAVMGGSAGGNLAVAALVRRRDQHRPMPAALILEAPEVDLTESGDSFVTLAAASNTLQSLLPVNRLYAAGRDLADPALSPLFADLHGLPPTLLWTGTRDLFLSNTVRLHRALIAAGTEAHLHVWDGMPHGGFPDAPEGQEVNSTVRQFLRDRGL